MNNTVFARLTVENVCEKLVFCAENHEKMLIIAHRNPDGDAVGSTNGLAGILRLSFPEKEIYVQSTDRSEYLSFLCGDDAPIDPALYEAAKIDGASKLKQIWNITIPSIMPTIIVMLIIRIGYLMDAGFEQVYAMLNPNTLETGEIIGTYVYRLGFLAGSTDYGLSTAVGLFNGIISLLLILGANYISKKKTGNGVW